MRYKNIEIHNIAELVEFENGGVTWLRVPENVYRNLESDQGKRMVKGSTGVELRLVVKSEKAVIKLQSLSPATVTNCHIFYGGIQGGWDGHEVNKYITAEPFELEIKRPENLDVLRKISKENGYEWDPEVVRVIFNRGSYKIIDVIGDVEPPRAEQKPSKTLLCYGSSITHGSNSLDTSHSWTSVLAHNLNMDLINLGMAGSCAMEPEMIEYIASEGEKGNWDIANLELGINVLGWEEAKIRERVKNTLRQIAGRNPDKKIFVVSPFYCNDDYFEHGLAEKWRRLIPEIIKPLNLPNVTLINGKDMLGDMSLISADLVHPNIYGVAQIAERLSEIIKSA